MKAKLDKDYLVKNRFWIVIGAMPLLWLIAWLVLITVVADSRDAKAGEYKKQLDGVTNIKNPKNDSHVAPLREKQAELQRRRDKVWEVVWKSQEDMMTWPNLKGAPPSTATFGDDIVDLWRREYAHTQRGYVTQLLEFEKPPAPVYYFGDWRRVIEPVKWLPSVVPTVEECWLAQEELWVKRELLKVIKAALDAVAQFDDVARFKVVEHEYRGKEGGALAAGVAARQLVRNPHWELGLILQEIDRKELDQKDEASANAKDDKPAETPKPAEAAGGKAAEKKEAPVLVVSAKSQLKNITSDKKELPLTGLVLRLAQRDAQGTILRKQQLEIKGEPLAWNSSREIGQTVRLNEGGFNFKEPIDVEILEDKADPVPKGFVARQRLRNPSWEIELLLEKEKNDYFISAKSQLKNIHPTQRTLELNGVKFRVKQGDQAGVEITIQGEPLPWGAKPVEFGARNRTRIPRLSTPNLSEKPLEVEQVLDWAVAPIKRIDEIRLGYHSHRTALQDLVPRPFGPVDPNAPPSPSPSPTPNPGLPAAPDPGARDGGEGFEGQPVATGTRTINGVERNRYCQVTNQVRRLPLGMVLIVDQAHIQDVLTAFSNSRLRIQPTQVHWHHVRGVRPYNPEDDKKLKPGFEDTRFPGGKLPVAQPRPITPAVPPPGQAGAWGARSGVVPPVEAFDPEWNPLSSPLMSSGEDANAVQLSIYGIASLYERFKPSLGNETGAPGGAPVPGGR